MNYLELIFWEILLLGFLGIGLKSFQLFGMTKKRKI
jgi:hypothetical protein